MRAVLICAQLGAILVVCGTKMAGGLCDCNCDCFPVIEITDGCCEKAITKPTPSTPITKPTTTTPTTTTTTPTTPTTTTTTPTTTTTTPTTNTTTPTTTTTTPTTNTTSVCDEDWIMFMTKCYLFATCNRCSADYARDVCRNHSGMLAKVATQAHQDFIVEHAPTGWIVIGAEDRDDDGTYTWGDGTPLVFSNWGHGEPVLGCVVMEPSDWDDKWYTWRCDGEDEDGYVCEK